MVVGALSFPPAFAHIGSLPPDPIESAPLEKLFEEAKLPSDPALLLNRRCRVIHDYGYSHGTVRTVGICAEGVCLDIELDHQQASNGTNPHGYMRLRGRSVDKMEIVTRVQKRFTDGYIDQFEPANLRLL